LLEKDSWQIPAVYSSVERETQAARTGLALADVSAWARISYRGREVGPFARALCGDGPVSKPRGVWDFEAGDRILGCRLTDDHLLLLAFTTDPAALNDRLTAYPPGPGLFRTDATTTYAGFCLMGGGADEVLRLLTPLNLSETAFPPGHWAETGLAGVHSLLVRPAGHVPSSVLIHVGWDLAEYVWDCLLSAAPDISPLGWEGLRALGLAGA
jgi:glycine cleavage system aminomethyltransferase T